MMSHISFVCSRKSSGRPFAGRSIVTAGRVRSLGRFVRFVLALTHAIDTFFHFPHARQIFVQLVLIARTDLRRESLSAILHAVENAQIAALPRFSNRLSQASDG